MKYVVAPAEHDATEARVTFDHTNGSERLTQAVLHLAGQISVKRSPGKLQEVLYVVSGAGTLHSGGKTHVLEAGTGVLLGPGTSHVIESGGGLTIVSVAAPTEGPVQHAVVRLADCEVERADEHRTFCVLLDGDMTAFVGFVAPSRAPDHSHPYDEVGYVLEGSGLAHVDGTSIPIGPGACFHLPPEQIHCIENSGPGVMQILGVFHPAGSPRQRA